MFDFFHHFDVTAWVATLGYVGLSVIILLEMGFFFGFFLPGDSLLFAAGLLASKGVFSLWILIPLLIVIAVIAYLIGYWFGDKLGHCLMKRKDSFYFKKKYMHQAHQFYEKHGGKALIIGRCVPIVRTFVPIVAGMVEMGHRRYFLYNVSGAVIWVGLFTLSGYYIGAAIPHVNDYILSMILLIIFLSILPGIIHFIRNRHR